MNRIVVGLTLAAMPLAAIAGEMTPGTWQAKGRITAVDMPGAPPGIADMMKARPIDHSYCLTPEQAAKDPRELFSRGDDCRYTSFDMAGGRMDAVAQCSGDEGDMTMVMTGTYTGTSYKSTSDITISGPMGTMKMTSEVSGTRVGDC